ncbi:MAG: plastocyanin/azurin family copper-binding protein [Thermoanaerobaculia bacterium]
MRTRTGILALIATLALPLTLFANDVWIPVAGRIQGGNFFRSDLTVVNPSGTADAAVTIAYLPVDNVPAPSPVTETIPRRQMKVYTDVVGTLFNINGLGVIHVSTPAGVDVIATSRIFTDTTCTDPAVQGGTYGQFVPGFTTSQALMKGVIPQLAYNADTSSGFRSNVGFANPNNTDAAVVVTLHKADGSIVGKQNTINLKPHGGLSPTSLPNLVTEPGLDLASGFVTFSAALPIIGYGSVVDNRSADQIFVAAVADTGTDPVQPQPQTVTVNVGPGLSFSPEEVTIKPGDTVRWVLQGGIHTTTSDSPTGPESWNSGTMQNSGQAFSHTFHTVGDYPYYCKIHSSPGGTAMNGVVHVVQ